MRTLGAIVCDGVCVCVYEGLEGWWEELVDLV